MYLIRLVSARLVALSVMLSGGGIAAAQQNYQPVPSGFDFPADEATLLRFRDTQNAPEMRRHSWYVFAGLTQRAKNGEAIWETWFPSSTTFSPDPQPIMSATPVRPFEVPRQFTQRGASP